MTEATGNASTPALGMERPLARNETQNLQPKDSKTEVSTETTAPELSGEAERVGFKAGWAARTRAIDDYLMHDVTPDVQEAWSRYEPQGVHVAADVLIDRLQQLLDSYAGNTRAYVDVLDFQALINRARLAALKPQTPDVLEETEVSTDLTARREQIARLLDPELWLEGDRDLAQQNERKLPNRSIIAHVGHGRAPSLAKADAILSLLPSPTAQGEDDGATYYGKDCPVGMVQVEFVGCSPAERYSDYGWKPTTSAFIELYVDGQRYRIDAGDIGQNCFDGVPRRGVHINYPMGAALGDRSMNALNLANPDEAAFGSQSATPQADVTGLVEALEKVREWIAMVEAAPVESYLLKSAVICQPEIEAMKIVALAAGKGVVE